MISIVVAFNQHRVIGVDGKLPWRIPEDMKVFKQLTEHHVCVMGRKTWESLPPKFRPLPNRTNAILTRRPDEMDLSDCKNAFTFDDIHEIVDEHYFPVAEEIFVIGGGEVYKQALELQLVDRVYASEVKGFDDLEEGVKFPDLKEGFWEKTLIKSYDEFNLYQYDYLR